MAVNCSRHGSVPVAALTQQQKRFIRLSPSRPKAHSLGIREKEFDMDKLRALSKAFVCGSLATPVFAN